MNDNDLDLGHEDSDRRRAVLVRGLGDVASAVAHLLFTAGLPVALHEDPPVTVSRRGMAFADAAFDGVAVLAGVTARRLGQAAALEETLGAHREIPVLLGECPAWRQAAPWRVLVDARMRKRVQPEPQRGLAALAIGLGPGFVAGGNVDLAVETQWGETLGAVIATGPTLDLAGEPRPIGGLARQRYVYAPAAGVFATPRAIGGAVAAGDVVGTLDGAAIAAPAAGRLRGLVRDGVAVAAGTKLVEIDPRGAGAQVSGIAERPAIIARGVLAAIAKAHRGVNLPTGNPAIR